MIVSFLSSLGVWNWFILGGVLMIVEALAPGTFMLWLGLAAVAVGVLSLLLPWPWQAQLVAFAVLSIVSLVLWRRFRRASDEATDQPFLNRRADALVGRSYTLDKPIVQGVGTIRVDDTVWRILGPDCPAGTVVTVTKADGAALTVAPAG
jgi:membrane protein implicated in regulation of membrane protease activity